jgi:hypothetical protein
MNKAYTPTLQRIAPLRKISTVNDPAMTDATDMTFADANGEFDLLDGETGQPGCSECETESAVVRVGGRHGEYLCATSSAERGIDVPEYVLQAVREWDAANPDDDSDEDDEDELTDVTFEVTITLGASDSAPTEGHLETAILRACERESEIAMLDGVKVKRA